MVIVYGVVVDSCDCASMIDSHSYFCSYSYSYSYWVIVVCLDSYPDFYFYFCSLIVCMQVGGVGQVSRSGSVSVSGVENGRDHKGEEVDLDHANIHQEDQNNPLEDLVEVGHTHSPDLHNHEVESGYGCDGEVIGYVFGYH